MRVHVVQRERRSVRWQWRRRRGIDILLRVLCLLVCPRRVSFHFSVLGDSALLIEWLWTPRQPSSRSGLLVGYDPGGTEYLSVHTYFVGI